jgi:hypothetical protein
MTEWLKLESAVAYLVGQQCVNQAGCGHKVWGVVRGSDDGAGNEVQLVSSQVAIMAPLRRHVVPRRCRTRC